jgi:hypothetical protein
VVVATWSDCICLVSTTATDRFRERHRPGIDPKLPIAFPESGHSSFSFDHLIGTHKD